MKFTLAEAIGITPEARIITTATYPYTIVHTNRAWSEMTGYRFTEVVRADCFPWLSRLSRPPLNYISPVHCKCARAATFESFSILIQQSVR